MPLTCWYTLIQPPTPNILESVMRQLQETKTTTHEILDTLQRIEVLLKEITKKK